MIDARDRTRLGHMLAHAERALRFLGSAQAEQLEANEEKLFAIILAVEVVGEAASQISLEGRQMLSGLPLREARNMRHVLIHAYPEIDVDILVKTVRDDFPELISTLHRILAEQTS